MRPIKNKHSQKGQVLLLVVLVSVIALTVGLAAISRSITSTRISSEESNSQKALSAAEAGVEEQINKALAGFAGDTPLSKDLNNNTSFLSEAVAVNGVEFPLSNGEKIQQDDGADIWLSEYPDFDPATRTSTSLTIYWNAPSTSSCSNNHPAIEVAVIYGDAANPSMSRYAFDSCSNRGNNFTAKGSGTYSINFGGNTFSFNRSSGPIVITNGFIARVIPLYASTEIGVESSVALPDQGYVIESTGESGETVRKLRVYQGFPKLPIEFFPYNLFLP